MNNALTIVLNNIGRKESQGRSTKRVLNGNNGQVDAMPKGGEICCSKEN